MESQWVQAGEHMHPVETSLELSNFATPHIRNLENSLKINSFIDYVENIFEHNDTDLSDSCSSDIDDDNVDNSNNKISNGKWINGKVQDPYRSEFSSAEWEEEKMKFYNLKSVGADRLWLQETLLSETDDSGDEELTDADLQIMLRMHVRQKKLSDRFSQDGQQFLDKFSFYGSSLILEHDKYHDRQKKRSKLDLAMKKKRKFKFKKENSPKSVVSSLTSRTIEKKKKKLLEAKLLKQQQQHERDMSYKRKKIWNLIVKKEIPKACRTRTNSRGTSLQTLKKVAQACQRERRKEAVRSQKISKEMIPRARRMAREMLLYWRRFDRVEKEHRKKAEKEALEQRRLDEEMREMKRQQRKLNFLITQTELYAHFMGRKNKAVGQDISTQNEILKKLEDSPTLTSHRSVYGGVVVNNTIDDYDSESMKSQALLRAQNAVLTHKQKISKFQHGIEKTNPSQQSFDNTFSLANPNLKQERQHAQPKSFKGKLKAYQLKGMNWLINLYEQGINGILADEMGLGKTVQSIVFLAYLAEVHNIWGPFLIVAPASTLHNWQQEFTKFLPRFKVLPYWGDPNDRKSLRKFWNQNSSSMANSSEYDAAFHVLITSYQLVVQDVKYFQRIKWQYLVLDEAHAIKSSSSIRWKILLGYNCRNRLLLTGTPIQNTMAELWALLHFIMPTLFDSHDEFNEWFSKDIENHASDKKPSLDQNQLSRLHMILKPFMLRRVKKDVENELSEKIEIKVMCNMSSRQKLFYQAVKNKILFEDLLVSANAATENKSTSLLMNLVMQFRKVCNHPELFERKEPTTGFHFELPPIVISKLFYRNGILSELPNDKIAMFEKYFLIWNSCHIHHSLSENGSIPSNFAFTRFIDLSPNDCAQLFRNLVSRLKHILLVLVTMKKLYQRTIWREPKQTHSKYLSRSDLLICQDFTLKDHVNHTQLCFVRPHSDFSAHTTCLIKEIQSAGKNNEEISCLSKKSKQRSTSVSYPTFLKAFYPKVLSPYREVYCSDRSAAHNLTSTMCGSADLITVFRSGVDTLNSTERASILFPPPLQGLDAVRPRCGWSSVKLPDRSTLLSDSGKLLVLDKLLTRMKIEGHRVLIYSQMTKMIDILEQFMNFRQHSYMRLDGSSKISDRRDMVADFQSKGDIFAFLLSTRAGGLGINLTAADTVIFYDSDWNPTVDQQAMDRAHRLGQTKQVTVYRLVTKGTIEEKILNRAREKSEIQNIVISGGQFNKDVLRPKEVVSLLLDDAELETKLKQRQVEKKLAEESGRKPGRKRKPVENNMQVTDNPKLKKKAKNGVVSNEESSSVVSENSLTGFESVDIDENSVSSMEAGILINDEENTDSFNTLTNSPIPNLNTPNAVGRKRGRGRGNGSAGRGRGKSKSGTLAKAAASAAAAAGAAAGSAAAYAAYGYSFQASSKTN